MRNNGKALIFIGIIIVSGLFVTSLTTRASQVDSEAALHIDAVTQQRLAEPGGTAEAGLVVAVTSDTGVVRDLTIDNFQSRAILVPPGGCQVTVKNVTSQFPGTYLLDIVPFAADPNCPWLKGKYSLGVFVVNEDASGVSVAELIVE